MSYELPVVFNNHVEEKDSSSLDLDRWKLTHPLLSAAQKGEGFVCFHTHTLTDTDIERAIEEKRSIEIDALGIDPVTDEYIPVVVLGHHPWMYLNQGREIPDYEQLRDPSSIIDQVVDAAQDILVKIDIKSPTSLPWAVVEASRLAPDRRMLHAFVKELHASAFSDTVRNPYLHEPPHAVTEYVELELLHDVKSALHGIPIQVSCRGFSLEDIAFRKGDNLPILDQVCNRVKTVGEVVNLNLAKKVPGEKGIPQSIPHNIIDYIWNKHQLMVELNLDNGETAPTGIPFLGRSDDMNQCTIIA